MEEKRGRRIFRTVKNHLIPVFYYVDKEIERTTILVMTQAENNKETRRYKEAEKTHTRIETALKAADESAKKLRK
jgi:hypothetical protein